jgi:parallel beta-helix repeat protein
VRLTKDLRNCSGDGLDVEADGVSIDLNGHTIATSHMVPPEQQGNGVYVNGHDRVTVKNGIVRGFRNGILFVNARASRVSHVTMPAMVNGGVTIVGGGGNQVDHNTIARPVKYSDEATAINLYSSNDNTVIQNVASMRVAGSHSIDASTDVIELTSADRNRILFNRVSDGGAGIGLEASSNNLLAWNIATGGQFGLIPADQSNRNVVEHNAAQGNLWAGIGVGSTTGNVVRWNVVIHNPGAGIIEADNLDAKVIGNLANGNGLAPTACLPDCPGFETDDGINTNSVGTTVSRNIANNNGDLGIQAVVGVIDGGQNTAHHNGDPRQCVAIKCR